MVNVWNYNMAVRICGGKSHWFSLPVDLTHWDRVTHICVDNLLVQIMACCRPGDRGCWNIVNWTTIRNKLQWISNRNSYTSIQENTLEKIVCEMASNLSHPYVLTHWGRATHVCVGKLAIIGSDNGLSPGRRQAIIWTIAGILVIGPSGTNFSEILIGIQTFSLKKMHLKISSAKWRPFVSASMY